MQRSREERPRTLHRVLTDSSGEKLGLGQHPASLGLVVRRTEALGAGFATATIDLATAVGRNRPTGEDLGGATAATRQAQRGAWAADSAESAKVAGHRYSGIDTTSNTAPERFAEGLGPRHLGRIAAAKLQ